MTPKSPQKGVEDHYCKICGQYVPPELLEKRLKSKKVREIAAAVKLINMMLSLPTPKSK